MSSNFSRKLDVLYKPHTANIDQQGPHTQNDTTVYVRGVCKINRGTLHLFKAIWWSSVLYSRHNNWHTYSWFSVGRNKPIHIQYRPIVPVPKQMHIQLYTLDKVSSAYLGWGQHKQVSNRSGLFLVRSTQYRRTIRLRRDPRYNPGTKSCTIPQSHGYHFKGPPHNSPDEP